MVFTEYHYSIYHFPTDFFSCLIDACHIPPKFSSNYPTLLDHISKNKDSQLGACACMRSSTFAKSIVSTICQHICFSCLIDACHIPSKFSSNYQTHLDPISKNKGSQLGARACMRSLSSAKFIVFTIFKRVERDCLNRQQLRSALCFST